MRRWLKWVAVVYVIIFANVLFPTVVSEDARVNRTVFPSVQIVPIMAWTYIVLRWNGRRLLCGGIGLLPVVLLALCLAVGSVDQRENSWNSISLWLRLNRGATRSAAAQALVGGDGSRPPTAVGRKCQPKDPVRGTFDHHALRWVDICQLPNWPDSRKQPARLPHYHPERSGNPQSLGTGRHLMRLCCSTCRECGRLMFALCVGSVIASRVHLASTSA